MDTAKIYTHLRSGPILPFLLGKPLAHLALRGNSEAKHAKCNYRRITLARGFRSLLGTRLVRRLENESHEC